MDLFEHQFEEQMKEGAPLATRMRPTTLQDFVGQEHIIGKGHVLRKAIDAGKLPPEPHHWPTPLLLLSEP